MRGGRSANSPPTESPRRISRLKAPPATKAEIGESSKLAVREARETLRLGGEQLVFYRERTMSTIAARMALRSKWRAALRVGPNLRREAPFPRRGGGAWF